MALEVDPYGDGKVFSERLPAQPDYLAYQQGVPQNTNANGNRGGQRVGKVQGYMQIVVRVKTDISLADTTNLTVKLQDSDDNGATDAYADLAEIVNITASGATVLEQGTELGSYQWNPDDKLWGRVNIATTDAAATGQIDVFTRFIGN